MFSFITYICFLACNICIKVWYCPDAMSSMQPAHKCVLCKTPSIVCTCMWCIIHIHVLSLIHKSTILNNTRATHNESTGLQHSCKGTHTHVSMCIWEVLIVCVKIATTSFTGADALQMSQVICNTGGNVTGISIHL